MPLDPLTVSVLLTLGGSILSSLTQKTPKQQRSARDSILLSMANRYNSIRDQRIRGERIVRNLTGKSLNEMGIAAKPMPGMGDFINTFSVGTNTQSIYEGD